MNKSFAIYFNKLPPAIEDLAAQDKFISITKEGVRTYGGLNIPKITIKIKASTLSDDADRLRKINNLLKYLRDSGQIVDFTYSQF